jgi:hypothetical protein
MPPAKKPKLTSPGAGQPTIGAAFARRGSGGGAAGEEEAAGGSAPALPHLLRERADVLEYSDFDVNNLKNDAGARPTERALESEAVDDGAPTCSARIAPPAPALRTARAALRAIAGPIRRGSGCAERSCR